MPRKCTICTSPDRAQIDAALVAGCASIRDIARQFAVGRCAVERHRPHLSRRLLQAKEGRDVREALDVITQLKAINGVCIEVLNRAREARDDETLLKAVDRIAKQIELQAKLLGELDERPVVNLILSPEWVALRTRILVALASYPEAKLALVEALDVDE